MPSVQQTRATVRGLNRRAQVEAPTSNDLIERALRSTPTQKALSHRLRVSESRMSRIVRGGRISIERCVFLAELLREDLALVLVAFGYGRAGRIVRRLYVARGYTTPERANMHAALDHLSSEDYHAIGTIIDRLRARPATNARRGVRGSAKPQRQHAFLSGLGIDVREGLHD